MILFQMHIMWYEAEMVNETLDSIQAALEQAPGLDVRLKFCINKQTYLEQPQEGTVDEMVAKFMDHPLMSRVEIWEKDNRSAFYNIADWRREIYNPAAKYTVWGETDTLLPVDFFYILQQTEIDTPHLLTFASRPMWDNSWDTVTHSNLQGYSKPCKCGTEHRADCIELLKSPLKYKDVITQDQLDKFNQESDIVLQQVPLKIDGALLCISKGVPYPWIPADMHFVREDTCAENFFKAKLIPQICVTTRLKGHNYWHPKKRVNTSATRNDELFKEYAKKSEEAMITFLRQVYESSNNI